MNNEPVAWIDEETGCFVYSQYDYEDLDEYGKDGLIPLYTHPVKELTDEEINARKVSIRTVENTIGLARSVANGTTKFPFMGYCADLMEKMLEEIKEARNEQTKKEQ